VKSRFDTTIPNSILFVEDDEMILAIQASILTARFPDVMVYTALNGRLGLELFKTHRPDIVITDINMPEMCGVQMSVNIRTIKPNTKFIAITGKSIESDINGKFVLQNSDNLAFDFDHINVKPVDIQELFATVERLLGKIVR
jgi:CheY-like chemotaxis protein